MHIVFVTLSLRYGGAERVISNLCNYLSQDNKVTVATYICEESRYDLNNNVTHRYIDKGTSYSNLNKVSRFIKRREQTKKIMEELKPDIIVAFLPEPSFIVSSLKKQIKRPIIISVRNDPKIEYSFFPYKLMMKKLYPLADGYVFQTEEAKQYFKFNQTIINNSIVIPNPINDNFIKQPYLGERDNEIVSVGRLEPQKNHKLLINAFAKVANKYPKFKLIIYGEGSLRNELESLIDQLGLKERVLLPGEKNNIRDLIYKASVFVLSSNYEGMPNALMEAMVLGLPVISTDCPCGGSGFLINNGINGILTSVDDVDQMSNAISRLISDMEYSQKLGVEANKISESLHPSKINKIWEDFITIHY
ncbi:MAG: glycosyltransferase family 4 protein [Clostridiaceae bacterium]